MRKKYAPLADKEIDVPILDVLTITYNMMILALDQARKSSCSCETVVCFVRLPSNLEWNFDVYAQLKIKVCSSFLSAAIFLIFLEEIPALTSEW